MEWVTKTDGSPHEFFWRDPWGHTLQYDNTAPQSSFKSMFGFTGHIEDGETGLIYAGARYYEPRVSVWLSVDPLAHMYPTLSPYNYVANNPIIAVDPDGRHIDPVLEKGAGQDGRDLLTINITGKIINFSGNNINMEKALADIKSRVEEVYQGQNIDGIDIKVNFDFEIAEDMDGVKADDHLIILGHAKNSDVPEAVSEIGGMVAVLDGDYFSGWFDVNFGTRGQSTAAHEVGHWFGLMHKSKVGNVMKQGYFQGKGITDNQLRQIKANVFNPSAVNKGSNSMGGLPNLGLARTFFELRGTYGRIKQFGR